MKRLGKLLLAMALLSGVVYAQKVKVFDLKQYKLEPKEKNKLETYKVGAITLKTDLKYYENTEMYYQGSKMYLSIPKFEGITLLIKKHTNSDTLYYSRNGKITFFDDFSESVIIYYWAEYMEIDGKKYKIDSHSTIKFKIKDNEILVFNGKEKFATISTKHMEKIVSYEQTFGYQKDYKQSKEKIYQFMIIGEK